MKLMHFNNFHNTACRIYRHKLPGPGCRGQLWPWLTSSTSSYFVLLHHASRHEYVLFISFLSNYSSLW